MISEKSMQACEELSRTNPAVREMFEKFKILSESPYVDIYMASYDLLDAWRVEIGDGNSNIRLAQAEDKVWDRAFKLLKEMPGLVDGLEELRDKMTLQQKEDVDKARRTRKSEGKVVLSA